ncbi:MAG TPA: histone-lysine N-methyltransferase [Candidatus Latescibacteria bacterium]|nr:histone-lysine N-methyltransferase [Candidatus Latescibacterota bacterium]
MRPPRSKYQFNHMDEPNLFREIYPYTEVPKMAFDGISVPIHLPDDIWITDTTFRDGQQARPPYTVKQVIDLYDLLHRLGGPNGVIRQSEFFLYNERDREAVEGCLAKGYKYPEVTGWIRASKSDFQLVKQMGLKETGILTSASDYHIFFKFGITRNQAAEIYLDLVRTAMETGVRVRCHLEDITRADFTGFVIPFVQELMEIYEQVGEEELDGPPIKIRLCDTMGFGLPYPEAALPRSIPKIVHTMIHEAGVPCHALEWHGHNDFHKALVNSEAAWLYGCAAANGTLLGFGERCGNPPLEGLIIEYIALKGDTNGVDTTAITDIGDYFRKEIGTSISPNYPFVGSEFNLTRAGIHADGALKNEEIYNIFDTAKILNRPQGVIITDKSGTAGIAYWINSYLNLKGERLIDKRHPGVAKIHHWVMEQYRNGRITGISSEEMLEQTRKHLPELFISDFDRIKARARMLAQELIEEVIDLPAIRSMDPAQQEPVLKGVIEENPFIQLIAVTDTEGRRVTKNITQAVDKSKYEYHRLGDDFSNREWFLGPMKSGQTYVTGLYTSAVTGALCITVSAPIRDENEDIVGILEFDIKFEDLVKLEELGHGDDPNGEDNK